MQPVVCPRTCGLVLIVTCLLAAACDRKPQAAPTPGAPGAPAQPGSLPGAGAGAHQPQDSGVNLNITEHGPVQLESLTAAQMDRVRKLQGVFAEVDGQSIDQRADAFRREADPGRALARWEVMAGAYTAYCSRRVLPLATKKEVYQVVQWRSVMPEKDVLERVDRQDLKVLTRSDVMEIVHGF